MYLTKKGVKFEEDAWKVKVAYWYEGETVRWLMTKVAYLEKVLLRSNLGKTSLDD